MELYINNYNFFNVIDYVEYIMGFLYSILVGILFYNFFTYFYYKETKNDKILYLISITLFLTTMTISTFYLKDKKEHFESIEKNKNYVSDLKVIFDIIKNKNIDTLDLLAFYDNRLKISFESIYSSKNQLKYLEVIDNFIKSISKDNIIYNYEYKLLIKNIYLIKENIDKEKDYITYDKKTKEKLDYILKNSQ